MNFLLSASISIINNSLTNSKNVFTLKNQQESLFNDMTLLVSKKLHTAVQSRGHPHPHPTSQFLFYYGRLGELVEALAERRMDVLCGKKLGGGAIAGSLVL